LDENKKKYTTNRVKVPKEFIAYSSEQIKKAEKGKNKEHILKRKYFALGVLYRDFKQDSFDDVENYKIEWTKKNIIETK
jgi:hypothetical protein